MKKIRNLLLALAVIFILVIIGRTIHFSSGQMQVEPLPLPDLNPQLLTNHLAEAIRFATVSYEDTDSIDYNEFERFHRFLERTYPLVYARLTVESVHGFSLLFTWEGMDSRLAPVLLMAHQDVVPAEGEERWTHPPFDGVVDDTYIWGRGALDDKSCMMAILEAVSYLLETGYEPERTVYLAFGHDEEIGGRQGALKTAGLLESRSIRPEFVLDEGMAVVRNVMPGLNRPLGLIGVAEKGYLTIRITANAESGHSSMPPAETAIGNLSQALMALQSHPPSADIDGVAGRMFDAVSPHMSFLYRMIFANAWVFKPMILRQLEKQPSTNALIRTTTAFTTVRGGNKENVLPPSASATVNFRIKPGDTIDSIVKYAKETLKGKGAEITDVNREFASNPSKISPSDSEAYEYLQWTIARVFPDAVIAPGLVIGGTDSRHFESLSHHIYRFVPLNLDQSDLKRIHGVDERISITDFTNMVRFYTGLMENLSEMN